MSRPSEPVETVSTSIDLSFLPSRMIEPLPKLRSIWESAASRAFDLSMEEPSTRRNALVLIAPTPYRTGFAEPTTNGQRKKQCTRFVLCSQYVLFPFWVSVLRPPSEPRWQNSVSTHQSHARASTMHAQSRWSWRK